ncbi:MAG: glycosyltransferase, partial [Candidatus Bipolaricaulota bacterium]
GTIVYDLIDDWNTSLGSAWYSEAVERRVVASSDALVATVPSLVERLQRMSGRQVHLLPNAVNTHLFDPNKTYECPVDMPEASWVAIYIGALWGDWFDWELLVEVAARYPEAAVAAIGDYRGQCTDAPPNLHFLGLKSQQELPAYLSHADVAIIPWKDSPITKATSPLKVYEYIAMRRPVVAPHLAPLEGIPGVFLAKDRPDFLSKVEKARREPFPVGEVSEFLEENDWRTRVHQLIKVTEKACTRVADPMQRDHDFEQRLAEIVGEPIREVRINRIDFERFKADYRDGRAIDDEKRLEYYITCRWMDFKADDVFIDVAAQDCPLAFYVRDTYGCRVYRQDPYYIKPGINGEDIGGDAASLPLPDGSITKMALHNSFEHFEGDTDIRFIKEAQRVLRAGGKLCIVPLFIGDRYIQETDAGWLDDKGVKHLWGAGARFARCYDLDHFRKRILDNSMSFRVKIYRVVNFGELSSSGYLRYFAIFEKE